MTTAVVTDTAPVSPAVATGATPTVRTLVYELPAAEPTQTPEAKLPNVTVEPTGEPWLVDGPSWATITAESDDPRLETVAERVPDHSPTPLAIRVVAERPSRPHEHTHSGNR